jgi:hypothetical protein
MSRSRSIILSAALLTGMPIAFAQAGVISPQGIGAAVEQSNIVEHVQYRWSGREYCWYPSGWHGPGWYWCGYRLRVGHGWGGPAGWHGWNHRGRDRVGIHERGRLERRGSVNVERGRVNVERGRIEGRGRVGVEERGRIGTEGRGSLRSEQRGRIGVDGGATTGKGGTSAPGGLPTGGGMREQR